MTAHLATGRHIVEAPCPSCGAVELIVVQLTAVLTTPADDTPSLRVRAKSKAADHLCGGRHEADLFAESAEADKWQEPR